MTKSKEKSFGWIEEEVERIKEENEKRLEELNYKPALVLNDGINEFEIDLSVRPREINTRYGRRWVFELIEPSDKCFICSDYLYSLVIQHLANNNASGRMQVIKSGQGRDTRYFIVKKK